MVISLRPLIFRFAVPACGLLALSFFSCIYITYPHIYYRLIMYMIKFPAPHPFVDWEYVPSAIRCWLEGADVYNDNTCFTVFPDPQPFPYSPLLLRATFLAAGEHWINVTMLAVCVLFFLSIATLPPPRSWRDLFIALFATFSSATFLVAERGNADLILFLMIVAAVSLRSLPLAFRLGGYGLIILAGLVKFYPFVALILVLRERPLVIAAVATISMAALAALLLVYRHELGLMAANLPSPSYFTLQFGSANLPSGIGLTVGKVMEKLGYADEGAARAIAVVVSRAILPILVVSAIIAAFVIARRCDLRGVEAELPGRELDFLIAGAVLICGCFFGGQSVIYRGIYFLLALPGLAQLSRQIPTPSGRRLFDSAGIAIVFVLWTPFLDQCLRFARLTVRLPYIGVAPRSALLHNFNNYDNFPRSAPGYLLWLAGEVAWWWIVTLLLAVLGAFVSRTELWKLFCRFTARRLLTVPQSGFEG
jgi:hypothetical protein